MNTNTIFLLLFSILFAAGLSFYQYFYKNNNKSKVHLLLACLRFITIFGILLLFINPIISSKTFEIIKTPLPIVVDNSNSIVDLKANAITLASYQKLISNSDLQGKFDVQSYQFDNDFVASDSFNFNGIQTKIDQVAKSLKSIYKNTSFPTVIITDGNQTSGNDYVYSFDATNKIFPLIVGDTTTFMDLKINQINVNKYAFLKNKFPVEVFINYSGTKSITANFKIQQGNLVINSQSISFSPTKKAAVVNILLPADKIGVQIFKASITSNLQEKNSYNNTKNFAVEVMDQKTNVAIISAINHPDVGALKRCIESNAQRKVTIVKPNNINDLQDYNVLIYYQPTSIFKSVFDKNANAKINSFIVTGTQTDFAFLNQYQNSLLFKMSNNNENYLAAFNTQFNLFAIDDIGFENFPPLENSFGSIQTNNNVSILLSSKIRNIDTNMPLLVYSENQGNRSAFLLGENIWKWRLQSHVDTKTFEKFDIFIDKTIQFLSSNDTKKSLIVNHERFYNSGDLLEITAQYFNKNYEFDEKARLSITVGNKENKKIKKYDLLKTNNAYKVNLDGLSAGKYDFIVKELNSNSIYKGAFEVLDFDIEKQFVNPDFNKLTQLATQTQGKVVFPDKVDDLIKSLLVDENYKPMQKAVVKKTPMINWIWLLILIAITLTSEWFVRKYNGLM